MLLNSRTIVFEIFINLTYVRKCNINNLYVSFSNLMILYFSLQSNLLTTEVSGFFSNTRADSLQKTSSEMEYDVAHSLWISEVTTTTVACLMPRVTSNFH